MTVNSILLSDLHANVFRGQRVDVPAIDLPEIFRELVLQLLETSGYTAAEFARRTGLSSVNLSNMKKKRRKGTWQQLERLVNSGAITPTELFGSLFDIAERHEHPRVTQPRAPRLARDLLRQRLASGEIHARASEAARERQTTEPPLRPKLTERLQSRKTGAKG